MRSREKNERCHGPLLGDPRILYKSHVSLWYRILGDPLNNEDKSTFSECTQRVNDPSYAGQGERRTAQSAAAMLPVDWPVLSERRLRDVMACF